MADVGAQQIRFIPAHQQAGKAHDDRTPAQQRTDGIAGGGTGQQTAPVKNGGQKY